MIITSANYLRMARRHLLRHKRFSLINILGLSTGIVACLLIYAMSVTRRVLTTTIPRRTVLPVRRTREISIRKILGASGRGLALHRWLASYAYHTSLTADMFGLPLLLLGIITLSVTGLRVIRTGLRSPVESLRAE